jgi:hypothetical protein
MSFESMATKWRKAGAEGDEQMPPACTSFDRAM